MVKRPKGAGLIGAWGIAPGLVVQPMPQSLARLHAHLIFSTKSRQRILQGFDRDALHKYMASVLNQLGCPVALINSVEDHVHILFELSRTVAVSEAVEEVKRSSSKWIKTKGLKFKGFSWQIGYSIFAVSASKVQAVRDYISNQEEHHRRHSFQEEYRLFLERHQVDFDERYVWD